MSCKILLATGRVTWPAPERRTDRYGCVMLYEEDNGESEYIMLPENAVSLTGKVGRLIAVVVQPFVSEHIGDLMRGIVPSLPSIGDEIVLGEGEFWLERAGEEPHEKGDNERKDDSMMDALEKALEEAGCQIVRDTDREDPPRDLIGLRPLDGRENDWLDPHALYRVHSSRVNLYFEETTCPTSSR